MCGCSFVIIGVFYLLFNSDKPYCNGIEFGVKGYFFAAWRDGCRRTGYRRTAYYNCTEDVCDGFCTYFSKKAKRAISLFLR